MKLISFALLSVLPYCIALYYPLSNFSQGNKRRTPQKIARTNYMAKSNCRDLLANQVAWGNGLQFSVKIMNDRSAALESWSAEIEFDRKINSFATYDGDMTEISDRKFKVSSKSYNGNVPANGFKQFSTQIGFNNDDEPKIVSIKINNEPVTYCDGKKPETTPETTPKQPEVTTETVQKPEKPAKPEKPSAPEKPAYPTAPTTKPEKPVRPPVSGGNRERGVFVPWPKKVMGLYILLADDDEDGYESEAEWNPELFEWQQEAANVLFFTFIHPTTMDIPPSFQKLAATRGTNQPGAVPKDTVILFAIGGYAYSIKPNPWWWLESKEKAEEMAAKVASWPELYGCDGIDLDLEEGAGSNKVAGPNMIHFIKKLRELSPKMIVSQPTYGYPAVQAEIDVINASFDDKGNYLNVADAIGLMVYEGTQSLNYVKNYLTGLQQWEGFPVRVNAPSNSILLGVKGAASSSAITTLARAAVKDDLLGIMVWYASVKNGFHYAVSWDASIVDDSIKGYKAAMNIFRPNL